MKQKLAMVLNFFHAKMVNGVEIVVCHDDQTHTVQPLIYVPFFNRVSGTGGFMFRAWWGRG